MFGCKFMSSISVKVFIQGAQCRRSSVRHLLRRVTDTGCRQSSRGVDAQTVDLKGVVLNRVIGLRITEFDTVADEIVLHQVGIHTRHDGDFLLLVLLDQSQPAGNRIVIHLYLIDFHPRRLSCRINDLVVCQSKGGIGRQYMRPIDRFLSRIGNRMNGGAVARY